MDTLLTALPDAAVTVPEAVAYVFAADDRVTTGPVTGARIHVDLPGPVRVTAFALGDSTTHADLGGLATIRGARAEGAPARVPADGLEPITGEPDLEAYLGGWER